MVGKIDKSLKSLLPENILHIAHTDSVTEMVELYSAADMYINLTHCDTYPTVNIEAAACGLPIITYNVGGSSEIANMCGGVIVPRNDLYAVLNAIKSTDYPKSAEFDFNLLDKKHCIEKYLNLVEGKFYENSVQPEN